MKRFTALVLCCLVYTAAGYAEKMLTIKTEYFDIIYAQSSAPSAALLAEYADGYADEICALLNQKLKKRMPVYLVPDTQTLNGYFTRMPYRRIVLYDTAAEDGALGNFSDTILSVFYHELTHAVSLEAPYSMLNLLPMSFVEGAAVSFESLHGQGRLHDPLLKHYLIQNKLDGTTPVWQEAAGARDMYPGGLLPYIYGGFFAEYLQKTYGMETYAKLWKPSWRLFVSGKFKSVYEKDVRAAWNQFLNAVPLPAAVREPEPFTAQTEKSGYAASAASSQGIAYYDFNRQAVYFSAAGSDGTFSSPVKLFTADYSLGSLSFSEDGNLLLVSDEVRTSVQTARKRSRIFDMNSRRFTGKPIFSSLAACFADQQTICSIQLHHQDFSLVLIDRTSGEVKKVLYTAGPGQRFSALYSPCAIGSGKIAFIAANGIKRTIAFADTETAELTVLPETDAPHAVRYLQSVKSGAEYVVSFSWAEPDMLYRLGLYYPARNELKLQQTDISGGVVFPAVLPGAGDTEKHSIVYIGRHATYNRLYTMTETALVAKTVEPALLPAIFPAAQQSPQDGTAADEAQGTASADSGTASKQPKPELFNPQRYRPGEWLRHAKIRPAFSMPNNIKKFGGYGFGLKFALLDPTEKIELNPSFMIFTYPFFMQGTFTAGFHFRPLSIYAGLSDELEAKTFHHRKTSVSAAIKSSVPLSYSWEALDMQYGISINKISLLSDKVKTYYTIPYRYTVLAHEAELRYRNLRSTRIIKSPFFAKDTRGLIAAGALSHAYCPETKTSAAVLQAQADCYLPVVPIRFTLSGYFGAHAALNPLSGTYSDIVAGFPVTGTNYLPDFSVYGSGTVQKNSGLPQGTLSGAAAGVCDITLFSYEVQSAGHFSPLFLNRFAFHTGYTAALFGSLNGKNTGAQPLYLDTGYLNCTFTFNGSAHLKVEYVHPIRTPAKKGRIGVALDAEL